MKKTNLVLGFMLIMLLALNTGLMAQTATQPASGDGSSGTPYQIVTLNNLYWITQSTSRWSLHYIQTANIDASTTSGWDGGAGFSPIGNNSTKFTGSYDGDGKTIDNLYINRSGTNYIGLFGYTNGSTISNLGVTNVDITGNDNVGGLVGFDDNNSEVNNSYSTGSVTGSGNYVGGLVGYNYDNSTVSNSYSTGSVTGSGIIVGGLVGRNSSSTISNSYSTGSVSGSTYVGGLVGYNDNSTVSNSFWDTQTSGQGSSAGGTGKTTA
ncbi:MAG: peptidase A26, partial [Candidatus Marinimicrobia bacterium]|nr:peptidase A26 [Candidatus Neomarinimicrobiota bacterium]